jgi:phosphatidylglycerol:prolipoprotein diacylglycerol transferase
VDAKASIHPSLIMRPELFRIPLPFFNTDLPIYGYGLMMVIGFLAGAHLSKYLARRAGYDGEVIINAGLIALVSGVLGARLSHVIENWSEFTRPDLSPWQNFLNMVNLRSGGLTFYGGLILATPFTILYGIYKKFPIRPGLDFVAPGLMVGLAFGRLGCFLNGCCHGQECELPWAVQFPYYSNAYVEQKIIPADPQLHKLSNGEIHPRSPSEIASSPALVTAAAAEKSHPVHPAQLYSSFNAFLIAAVCLAYQSLPHVAGRAFALMLILKGITRFLLEMLRTEPRVLGPLSFSMVVSIGLVAAGLLLWIILARLRPAPYYAPTLAPAQAM